MRTKPALLVVAVLIAAAIFIVDRPGRVMLVWQGWRVDTSLALLIFAVILLAVLAAALFHLVRKLVTGPGNFLRNRRERRKQQGYRALTQGMVAVAAGDAREAQHFAKQADALLSEPPLTLLLSAQAAQLNGDHHAARRYFEAMLERAETEFLGLRGLLMQALRRGDEAVALGFAERAKKLRPRTPWVLASLFELQARAGRWEAAEATLAEAVKRKALTEEASRHHRAVMLHERSRVAESEARPNDALRLAAKAHALEPGLVAAAVHYVKLLDLQGQRKHARKVLENAWKKLPHPDLAAAFARLHEDLRPLLLVKEFERLAGLRLDHAESHLALAAAALKARLWGQARTHLTEAGGTLDNTHPSPRVCRLMAELEEAEHDDHPAARAWLARASAADHNTEPGYVCTACGGEVMTWSALCPHCKGFDTIEWGKPRTAPAPRLAQAAELSPALPVPSRWPAAIDGPGPAL